MHTKCGREQTKLTFGSLYTRPVFRNQSFVGFQCSGDIHIPPNWTSVQQHDFHGSLPGKLFWSIPSFLPKLIQVVDDKILQTLHQVYGSLSDLRGTRFQEITLEIAVVRARHNTSFVLLTAGVLQSHFSLREISLEQSREHPDSYRSQPIWSLSRGILFPDILSVYFGFAAFKLWFDPRSVIRKSDLLGETKRHASQRVTHSTHHNQWNRSPAQSFSPHLGGSLELNKNE